MTKVLMLPLNYGAITQTGWYDSITENGCQLEIFDFLAEQAKYNNNPTTRRAFLNMVQQIQPDLVFMQIQHTSIIDGDTVNQIKIRSPRTKVAQFTIDCRTYVEPTYKDVARFCDYNFICSTGQLQMYKNTLQKEVRHLQVGYDPKLYYASADKSLRNYEYDCVFLAHDNPKANYPGRAERVKTIELLKREFGHKFALWGDLWDSRYNSLGGINQRDASKYYNMGFCSISVSSFNEVHHYFSDRLLMCLASGRPTVSLRFPGIESYFVDGCDLVIADTVQDIPRKVKQLKENPNWANYIGQSGAQKVFAEHTYYSRFKEVLEVTGLS